MLSIFGSPIRKAIKKTLDNRIKNAEVAYKAEMKNLNDNHKKSVKQEVVEHKRKLLIMDAERYNRQDEILQKRVKDIIG